MRKILSVVLLLTAVGSAEAASPANTYCSTDSGVTWLPCNPGGASGTQDVNLTQTNGAALAKGHGTAAGAIRVELPTDGTGVVNVTDGAGALNVILDSGVLTSVTTITNPVTVTDGAGALNTIIDSGTVTTITNPVTVTDGAGALNVIVDSSALPSGAATSALQGGGLPSALASDRLKVDGSGVTQPVSIAAAVSVNPDSVVDGANVAASGAGAGVLTNTPVATIGYAVAQVNISAFSATSVTPQASFDGGSTYATVKCRVLSSANTIDLISLSATGVYECVAGDHFQLTQVGAGAVTAKIALKRVPIGLGSAQTWTSAGTNTTAMLQVGGYDGATARRFVTTTAGELGTYISGYSYSHIAAGQATTTVKSGAGFLHNICFNSAATATNVTTVYDNTAGSGTVIAIPNAVAATVPNCLTYDVAFATGLTILTATANGSDMTVSYK